MTTHIFESSTWTPTPLVFELECPLVRVAGLIKSPCGDFMSSGLYWSGFSFGPLGTDVGGGSDSDGILVERWTAQAGDPEGQGQGIQ